MTFRASLLACAAAILLCGTAAPAAAKTFRFAFQGNYQGLDPYTLSETFSLGLHAAVYEPLTRRDKDLKIIPGLAEKWETVDPLRWRFHLRKNVKFHNGNPFTADDVIFSANRVRANGSDLKTRIPADAEFVKVDDHTVDVVLKSPNPILHFEWDTWYIMDKEWAEANNAVAPTAASATTPSHAALNANGTGAFIIETHQPGVKTTWKANPNWWNNANKEHNLTEVVFTPIASDPTRVAALLSGEVDMIEPVPLQDLQRVNANANTQALVGPELRTIFLGFDQRRDELKYSSVKGKNPFKDVRVRRAFSKAIDLKVMHDRVMRNASVPATLLISPLVVPDADQFKPETVDIEGAKKLLAEAGYPNGFEITLDCPNDRYVNDEQICQASVQMLARIGIKANLNAQTKTKYFARVLAAGGYDTSLYLLGWTPGSFDSWNVLTNITGCRDDTGKGGHFNFGGYCNPKLTEMSEKILVETDKAKRDAMIVEAWKLERSDVSHIPLHQQALAWGVNKKVKIVQRPDDQILLYWVNMQ